MGHKVNPKIFRINTTTGWSAKWFCNDATLPKKLSEDIEIRQYLKKKLRDSSVDRIETDRAPEAIEITIYTARPGVIIGKGGAAVDEMKAYIASRILKTKKTKVQINIKEVNKPNLSANIIAQSIALDIEKRMPYRRAMKKYIDQVMKAGAKGVKIICSGRLGGVDIARSEVLSEGKIPLQTLRADIDYSRLAATTTYGQVGIKVWIYRGDVFKKKEKDTKN